MLYQTLIWLYRFHLKLVNSIAGEIFTDMYLPVATCHSDISFNVTNVLYTTQLNEQECLHLKPIERKHPFSTLHIIAKMGNILLGVSNHKGHIIYCLSATKPIEK